MAVNATGDLAHLIPALGDLSLFLLGLAAVPIVAACIVLTWHGIRGSDPGPAAGQLLQLTRLILRRHDRL
jgi:hypothetical protein